MVGVDPSPAVFPYAEQSAANAGLPPGRLEAVLGTAERLPLGDGAADVVVCTHVSCGQACASLVQAAMGGASPFYGARQISAPSPPPPSLPGAGSTNSHTQPTAASSVPLLHPGFLPPPPAPPPAPPRPPQVLCSVPSPQRALAEVTPSTLSRPCMQQ